MSRGDDTPKTLRSEPSASREAGRPAWIEALAALSRPPRRAVRGLRNRIDALVHPWRRRRAIRALRDRLPVSRILVLCYGNICRSPYAEFRLREALEGRERTLEGREAARAQRPEVTSAGFFGPDRPSPEVAVAAALDRGIDLGPHRSRIVTAPFVAEHDVILVMTRVQVRATKKVLPEAFVLHLGDFDPATPAQRDIPDPYAHASKVFSEVYARIDRALETLVTVLHPDPRGKGRGEGRP